MKLLQWVQRSRRVEAEAAAKEALAAKIEASVEHKAALDRDIEVRRQSEKLAQINHENHFSAKLTRIYREGHA